MDSVNDEKMDIRREIVSSVRMRFKTMIPMLAVRDIRRSLEFYRDALGFKLVSEEEKVAEWNWCTLRHPGGADDGGADSDSGAQKIQLMLAGTAEGPRLLAQEKRADHHFSAIYYFYPDDVRALHKDLENKGYRPTPLEKTFYGLLEFSLKDPDGHLLSFGQDAG
ncbi:MAG: VOC family protein [bacterium]|nr:VOC family protein [bacterium]